MDDQFVLIENDPTPLRAIGIAESVIDLLAAKNIVNVADVVAEFRKAAPFEDVPRVGEVKQSHLWLLLQEHRARCADPRLFVRLLLNRSQAFHYLVIPTVVGIALAATERLGCSTFDRDDIGTVLASFAALLAFDLGRWSRAPTILHTPLSTSRCRIVAVLLVLAATRVAVSADYGWTEALRFVAIGSSLGALDALRTWARRKALEPRTRPQAPIADDTPSSPSPWDWIAKLPALVQASLVAGFFTTITAMIALLQAVIVEVINQSG